MTPLPPGARTGAVLLSARSAALLLTDWRDGTDAPAYEALSDALRVLVIDGRIPQGVRLPAERGLATALGVSRTTVANAYSRLRSDGFVVSLRGSGSVVRLPAGLIGRPDPERLGGVVDDELLDLRKAALHAAPGIAEAVERATRHLPAALAGIGYDTVGDPGLRAAIASRYTERGLPTDPSQIVVTIGAQHAIALLARVLVRRGDAVVVESRPTRTRTRPSARRAAGSSGPGRRAHRLGHDGTRDHAPPDRARRRVRHARAAQPDRGDHVAVDAGALAGGGGVDRDDGDRGRDDGELRIDGEPSVPLAAGVGSSGGPVVMIGSADKVFWGGLRIGWIRASRDLLQRLLLARPTGDLGTPVLDQLVARELVPRTEAVLEARRGYLRQGRDDVVGALRARLPEWDVPSPAGGLTTWVGLGRPVSSALVLAARAEGVVLASGGVFGPDGGFERFLRVPFTMPPADRVRLVDVLERSWERIGGETAGARGSLAAVV
ncbi:PLP-dependent aminotransferase family protein [Curtobacterium flaccumfaciens]|nr:PLP-dependent aminotransferase family protein [Curtobacterium flaccumfaciens]